MTAKRKTNWRNALAALIVGLLILSSLVLWAHDRDGYWVEYVDGQWVGADSGSCGTTGADQSGVDLDLGQILISAEATGLGVVGCGEATISVPFTYTHHNWDNWFENTYGIKGEVTITPEAGSGTTCIIELGSRVILDSDTLVDTVLRRVQVYPKPGVPTQQVEASFLRDSVLCRLLDGNQYKAQFHATVICSAEGGGTVYADFRTGEHAIDLSKIVVHHEHYTTREQYLPQGDEGDVQFECQLNQTECDPDDACGLDFWVSNVHEIEGFDILIRNFSNSDHSFLNDDKTVEINAYGVNLPYEAPVTIEADVWVPCNTTELDSANWICCSPSGKGPVVTAKAIPGHKWLVEPPIEHPELPGSFVHRFTMTNTDPDVSPLLIRGLQFFDSSEPLGGPLSELTGFTGEPIDDDIDYNSSLYIDYVTEGDLLGGYIYFRYDIDYDGNTIHLWGGHEVTMGEVPTLTGWGILALALLLLATGVWIVRQRRKAARVRV